MRCPKCDGFMVLEKFSDFFLAFYAHKCVNCGLIMDKTIAENRLHSRIGFRYPAVRALAFLPLLLLFGCAEKPVMVAIDNPVAHERINGANCSHGELSELTTGALKVKMECYKNPTYHDIGYFQHYSW